MAIAASFAGNLGQDGELRFVGQGTPLLSFSVAVSYFDKEKKTMTSFTSRQSLIIVSFSFCVSAGKCPTVTKRKEKKKKNENIFED